MRDESESVDNDQESGTEEEFRIRYSEHDDYNVHPASSVRGGVQIGGDFLFEFYSERYKGPEAEVYSITPEGNIGDHMRTESSERGAVRKKQIGVMMNQENAFNTAIWTIANLLGDGVSESDVENVIAEEFSDKVEPEGDSE